MKIFRRTLLVLLCLLLAAVAAAGTYYFAVTADAKLDTEKLEPASNSLSVYDKDGEFVAQITHGSAKKSVRLKDLPAHVPAAFIAAEDKHFYSHHGLDYKGIARAFLKNLQAGAFRQGASTISQQLVKNTQLSPERTIRRKLREIKLTRKLEQKYSKDEILEMYLNTIYFGHACYGIANAADFYFGKGAEELTAAESAMLAAIIKSPSSYSPFVNAEKCESARNNILSRMLALGTLSESGYEQARKTPLPERQDNAIAAQSYLGAVCREFENLPLFSPYAARSGCKIYTYMDARMQDYAETLKTTADRSGKSIVICDNENFAVSALYSTVGELRRQPGSVIKPLAVYAPAIEENLLSPCTPILDEKTDFDGYSPSNYKDVYHGYVSARTALAESLNVPAVKVLRMLGTEKSGQYLSRLGLTLKDTDKNLSLALGGMAEGYSLTELAGAYSSFAHKGSYASPAFIRRIEDTNGKVLYERSPSPVHVFSEDTAELINSMLSAAVTEGTAKKLAVLPFSVCAKTGTCGTDAGNTDAYAIGYTAQHTVAVWMGNADNTLTDISGGGLPCHYAMLLFKKLYAERTPTPLAEGAAIPCRIDLATYERDHIVARASDSEPDKYTATELFRRNNLPKAESNVFTAPNANAAIRCENGIVCIELCDTEYYSYTIKRECNGETATIFDGKSEKLFYDKTLKPNKRYTYTVQPYFIGNTGKRILGKKVTLPAVCIKENSAPDAKYGEWWKA